MLIVLTHRILLDLLQLIRFSVMGPREIGIESRTQGINGGVFSGTLPDRSSGDVRRVLAGFAPLLGALVWGCGCAALDSNSNSDFQVEVERPEPPTTEVAG